ncbi:hypothetical protein BGW39_010797 [Mortierella sp. 14UC]|nr:hypothetical protein BGW39_010797 [Mortierella sp. 14UC]
MLQSNTLPLLLAALALVHATQDAAHYALPPNIYDNIPAGLVTPSSFKTYPTPAPAGPSLSQRDESTIVNNVFLPAGSIAPPTPPSSISTSTTGPTGFDITTPLLNSIYTPGSALMMTWSNRETLFPDTWTPPQAVLDLITGDANFSGSPLLTEEDMRNLAKSKVQDLKAAQLANVIKDSQRVLLRSLRLVSWPLRVDGDPSVAAAGGDGAAQAAATTTTTTLSPKLLSDPGFNLLNTLNNSLSGRLSILGSSGGALMWTIPADWEYEGEFEIEIPLPVSSGILGQHKSRSFWILRDAITRQLNPQFNLPSFDQQQQTLFEAVGGGKSRGESQRQRDMGVFLGVAAMMSAFVLVGMGVVVGMYRRKWAAAAVATTSTTLPGGGAGGPGSLPSSRRNSHMHLESAAPCCTGPSTTDNNDSIKRTAGAGLRNLYAEYTSSSAALLTKKRASLLLEPLDLNLSEETLRGIVVVPDKDADEGDDEEEDQDEREALPEAEVGVTVGGNGSGSGSVTPVDESFVDLALYDSSNHGDGNGNNGNDSAATLSDEKRV